MRPSRKTSYVLVFAIALLILYAPTEVVAQQNVLDDILKGYKSSTTGWLSQVQPIAHSLFWKLAAIEFAWSAIVWAMQQDHIQSFTVALTKKIIGIGFFYALLLNAPDWIPAIIDSFKLTGQTVSTGATAGELTPSTIFERGIDLANEVVKHINLVSAARHPLAAMLAGWTAIFIVISFAIVAGQLMVALIESYIVISAGILFLGFGGSRWTTDLAQKYISYAVATGTKLFVLYLIIGVAMNQTATWHSLLSSFNFEAMLVALGGSILLVFLAFQIPSTAAGMLSGAPSLTAGAAASTGAAVGAGVTAAGARVLSPAASAAQSGIRSAAGMGKAVQAGSAYASAVGPSTRFAGLKTAAGDWGREAAATASRSVQGLSSGSGSIGSRAAAKRNAMTEGILGSNAAAMGSAPAQNTAMTAAAEGKSALDAGAVPQVSPPGAAGGAGRGADRLSHGLGSTTPNPAALNISDNTKSAGATHAAPTSEAAEAIENQSTGAERMRHVASSSGSGISEPSHAPDRLSGESGLGSAKPNETAINQSDSNRAADTTHAAPTPEKSTLGAGAVPQVSPPGADGGIGGAGRGPDRLSGEHSLGSTAPNPTTLNTSDSAKSAGAMHAAPASEAAELSEQPQRKQQGLFEGVQQVRPPQIPNDAAPTVGANIRIDLGGE